MHGDQKIQIGLVRSAQKGGATNVICQPQIGDAKFLERCCYGERYEEFGMHMVMRIRVRDI